MTSDKPRIADDHQTHPEESPELIECAQKEFLEQLQSEGFADPLPKASFHLMFLRTELFNVDLAVKRYKKYWKRRIELMGSDSPELQMDDEDMDTLEYGYARLVRSHPRLVYMDPARTARKYKATSVVKSIYYTMHHALEHSEELQRKGVVYIVDCGTIRTFDRKLVMLTERMFSDAFPARQTMCCLINLPAVAGFVVNLLRMIVKPEMRQRLHVVTDNTKLPQIVGASLQEMHEHVGFQPWNE